MASFDNGLTIPQFESNPLQKLFVSTIYVMSNFMLCQILIHSVSKLSKHNYNLKREFLLPRFSIQTKPPFMF
jgi:hypothetical protein